jgi:ADP-ribose pyrophosphatase
MDIYEKTVSSEYKFCGNIINLKVDKVLIPNGKIVSREVVEHPGGVTVAALTQSGEVALVRQFRYPYNEEVLELPAGKLERGENPLGAGVRELFEETGAAALRYFDLGVFYPTPGYCGEIIYLYAAKEISFTQQCLDEDEFVEVEMIPFDRAVEMVLNNEIRDGKTQAALLKLHKILNDGNLDKYEIKNWRDKI